MLWWLAQNTVSAALLALAVMVVGRVCNPRPSLRHALWLIVLLKLFAPPVVVWPWNPLELAGLTTPETPAETIDLSELQLVNLVDAGLIARTPQALQLEFPANLQMPPEEPAPAEVVSFSQRFGFLQPWLIGLWLTGAVVMLIVQVIRAGRFRRLMRGWRPAPRKLRLQVNRLSREMNLRSPRCLVLPGLHSPFIWSLVRPWLIWPAPLHDHLSPDAHKTVIVHELAHLRRRDHLVGWLQLAGECLFWWNPIFWIVRRQIRFYAELACDAWVMHLLPQARRAYAEALIEVTALISRAPAPVPALGMSGAARQDFERRLTMIMSEKAPGKAPLIGMAAIGLIGLAVLPGFSQDHKAAIAINPEAISVIEVRGQEANQARLDSLIGELDALLERVHASAPSEASPEDGKESTPANELKLIEAVELAYSDALLLKESDDTQSDKARDEKIKQIEKNLQSLLKEVQSLKGGSGAGIKKTTTTTTVKPSKPGADGKKPESAKAFSIRLNTQDGKVENVEDLILQLGDLKLNADKVMDGKKVILRLNSDVKLGDKKTINLSPSVKGIRIDDVKLGDIKVDGKKSAENSVHLKDIKVNVQKSDDGKSIIVNGKKIAIPDAGAGPLKLEGKDGVGIVIINVEGAGDHHPKMIEGKHLLKDGKGNMLFKIEGASDGHPKVIEGKKIIKDGAANVIIEVDGKVIEGKEAASKGLKFSTSSDVKEGEHRIFRVITDGEHKDGKPHVFHFTPDHAGGKAAVGVVGGEVKVDGADGKPVKVIVGTQVITEDVEAGGKKTIILRTTEAPKATKVVKPLEGKNITWSTTAPKTVTVKPFTGEGKVQTWTFVEGEGKGPHGTGVFKLPKGKATVVAGFLKENVKGAAVETKVEGDTLTVKGSPEAIKAIASMISLMQGKAADAKKSESKELKYEFRVVPDGKESSFKNFDFKAFPKFNNVEFTQSFPKFTGEWTNFTDFHPNMKWVAPLKFESKITESKANEKP
jgi:beta-lactamase regulating signal transducer with metallopeptidase domain